MRDKTKNALVAGTSCMAWSPSNHSWVTAVIRNIQLWKSQLPFIIILQSIHTFNRKLPFQPESSEVWLCSQVKHCALHSVKWSVPLTSVDTSLRSSPRCGEFFPLLKAHFVQKDQFAGGRIGLFVVRVTGLEPARQCHWNLNPTCLPIPPYPQIL